jgi:hypothetical protein
VTSQVLLTMWSEPAGSNSRETYYGEVGSTEPARFGQNSYNSVRRFVIIKANQGHCLCVYVLS